MESFTLTRRDMAHLLLAMEGRRELQPLVPFFRMPGDAPISIRAVPAARCRHFCILR